MKGTIAPVLSIVLLTSACHQPQNEQVTKVEVRPAQPAIIEDVRVAGNRRIPTETIQANIESKPGQPFNRVIVNRDEDRLRSLGYFDDVRVTVEKGPNGGPIVTFNVREKPPKSRNRLTRMDTACANETVCDGVQHEQTRNRVRIYQRINAHFLLPSRRNKDESQARHRLSPQRRGASSVP